MTKSKWNDLCALPIGWDGYGGEPVVFEIAHFGANLLHQIYIPEVPAPSIVPGSDGSVQIEWHALGYDVELDILGVNQVVATRTNIETGAEDRIELTNDVLQVREWMQEMGRRARNVVQAAA